MKVLQANEFATAVKKLPRQQKAVVDEAIRAIAESPEIGEPKVADLAGVRVYKFKMNRQLTLLAYEVDEGLVTLYLLKLGSHENFYRDLKKERD
ncbi:MAG: type II toxin-antitoxin system RelE/ParE family toxin [Alcanivoracaceae bacterium]